MTTQKNPPFPNKEQQMVVLLFPTNSMFNCQIIFTVLGNQQNSDVSAGKNKLHLTLDL